MLSSIGPPARLFTIGAVMRLSFSSTARRGRDLASQAPHEGGPLSGARSCGEGPPGHWPHCTAPHWAEVGVQKGRGVRKEAPRWKGREGH